MKDAVFFRLTLQAVRVRVPDDVSDLALSEIGASLDCSNAPPFGAVTEGLDATAYDLRELIDSGWEHEHSPQSDHYLLLDPFPYLEEYFDEEEGDSEAAWAEMETALALRAVNVVVPDASKAPKARASRPRKPRASS